MKHTLCLAAALLAMRRPPRQARSRNGRAGQQAVAHHPQALSAKL